MIKNKAYKRYSKKQMQVLTWWADDRYKDKDVIICDGAVRSGKTTCMAFSFVMWAMTEFSGRTFGLCGKTITSLKRNLAEPLKEMLRHTGMKINENSTKNFLEVSNGKYKNRFYYFGGKDESSAALIQGITLAGVLLDEVALMPRSFVEQAIARCSVTDSKIWFNCNPDNPYHWFKKEWIDKIEDKNGLYLKFTLDDNPSLSKKVIKRYHSLYSGAFYERFVLGNWSSVYGCVYPMFNPEIHTFAEPPEHIERYAVSCDYGTVNPSSFGLWGYSDGVWYRLKEYYYNSRTEGVQRTDEEHYKGLVELCSGCEIKPEAVVCDPSAASFIECIRRHGVFNVIPAKNDVMSGIRKVSDAITDGKIKISRSCTDTLREFTLYRWDEKSGADCPVKENDHAMDDIRYFVSAFVYTSGDNFFVMSLDRE